MKTFRCLNNNDVISARVSDHHPVIHGDVLFWNIMMQGKRRKDGFNNGFGIVESEQRYITRLVKIACIIAEAVFANPKIEIIGICEGPIEPLHQYVFFRALQQFAYMQRFIRRLHPVTDHSNPNWGLFMLCGGQYQIARQHLDLTTFPELNHNLQNRLALWKLSNAHSQRYFALAHFPFNHSQLPTDCYQILLQKMFNTLTNQNFIFCADFNFNPHLISSQCERLGDIIPANNSILSMAEEKTHEVQAVTVDGILLSSQAKRQYYSAQYTPGLFKLLSKELALLQNNCRDQNYNKLLVASSR